MAQEDGFIAALEEAKAGAAEGGVPIGACIVSADGEILGRGHNMRFQKKSATLHVSVLWSKLVCTQSLDGTSTNYRSPGIALQVLSSKMGLLRTSHLDMLNTVYRAWIVAPSSLHVNVYQSPFSTDKSNSFALG